MGTQGVCINVLIIDSAWFRAWWETLRGGILASERAFVLVDIIYSNFSFERPFGSQVRCYIYGMVKSERRQLGGGMNGFKSKYFGFRTQWYLS
jgi:hypothetical protein